VRSLSQEQKVRKESLLHFKIEILLYKVILHCGMELPDDIVIPIPLSKKIVIPITLVLAKFI
jgi:hypothetical protein